jgi:hypothetical protein
MRLEYEYSKRKLIPCMSTCNLKKKKKNKFDMADHVYWRCAYKQAKHHYRKTFCQQTNQIRLRLGWIEHEKDGH